MLVKEHNKRQLVNFLLNRWKIIIDFAAIERVHIASCEHAKAINQPPPSNPIAYMPQACLQIQVIKRYLIAIVPEVKFIDYVYEAQAPLNPNDFMDVFIDDHKLCITKIENILEKLEIT